MSNVRAPGAPRKRAHCATCSAGCVCDCHELRDDHAVRDPAQVRMDDLREQRADALSAALVPDVVTVGLTIGMLRVLLDPMREWLAGKGWNLDPLPDGDGSSFVVTPRPGAFPGADEAIDE